MYYTPKLSAETLKSSKLLTQTIRCHNSGFPLGELQISIIEGQLSYLEAHNDAIYLHPFYRTSASVLLKKLEDSLHQAQGNGWACSPQEQDRLRLLVSATMYCLGSLKQEGYSLPSFAVAGGSAGRLLALAKWYFFLSSQRLELPQYSVGPKTENAQWENFKHWLDAAFQVREDWGKKARVLEQEAQQRLYDENVKDIKSHESLKRIDLNKVWKWIANQMEDHVASGRLVTMKDLWLNGDYKAHEWLSDDVDDLQELLVKHCDCGNDIMFFINNRLNGIRALIRDFYSGFTLLGTSDGTGPDEFDGAQTEQEAALIKGYDDKVEQLESLPPKPQKESFTSVVLFIRAEAEWNILKRRWDQKQQKPDSQ
jgi:hypothetical protein